MNEEEMISQIKELISDRKSFITDDEETSEIFKKDVAALEMIIDKYNMLKESKERLNNKEEQLIRKLEDLIIVGEQVENEWAVDICKMIIKELKGDSSNE